VAVPNPSEPRIDVAFRPPAPSTSRYDYCQGWDLLVDLPSPIMTTEADKVRSFLERTSTSIDYVNDDASNFIKWDKNFLEDELSDDYDPVPMAASGRTPLNNALLDAFDWYVEQVEPGGPWVDDPLKECRKWYVVLITDGAESCVPDPTDGIPSLADVQRPGGDGGTYACKDPLGNVVADGAAWKFADPLGKGGVDVEEMKIFTVGFALAGVAPIELTCISDETDGEYYSARNAAELRNALYEVLNQLNTEDERAFSPFKVSPPPSGKGGPATEQDFLVVYPLFQPIDGSSLWTGNLYGFKLNKDQTTLPANADCEVDRTQLVTTDGKEWDAEARLEWQLANLGVRPVLMGQYDSVGGTWSRHDLTEIPTDANLRLYFENLMNESGGVTPLELQEVVNFVRNLWMDDADPLAPAPTDWDPVAAGNQPRPATAPVLGDFYHSQPTVVSPPSRSMFFFDYGFGTAHDYSSFMDTHEKRRRVVLVGGNDGLLHAFDGGIWDRNRTDDRAAGDFYHEQHDLGTGEELFAYLPHAVMPSLYELTYGDYQHYMVDGPISVSDAFIDNGGTFEWRTVALVGMRRGGRGIAALDVTQPDPIDANFLSSTPKSCGSSRTPPMPTATAAGSPTARPTGISAGPGPSRRSPASRSTTASTRIARTTFSSPSSAAAGRRTRSCTTTALRRTRATTTWSTPPVGTSTPSTSRPAPFSRSGRWVSTEFPAARPPSTPTSTASTTASTSATPTVASSGSSIRARATRRQPASTSA
jgi:hypothetical protein